METNQKPKGFLIAGKPTDREVESLLVEFRTIREGDIITHETMEVMAREKKGTNRYYQIVGRTRRIFQNETGIVLETLVGVGVRYPTGPDQMKHGVKRTRNHVKGIRRALKQVADVSDERLDDDGRKARDHVTGSMSYLVRVMQATRKSIELAVSTPELPPIPKIQTQ